MKIVTQVDELRVDISQYREAGLSVGFVPTMGNLHAGHLALVDAATKVCDKVVVSIFVNPMQFGPDEDLDTYPVTPEADEQLLVDHNTSLLYLPQRHDVYQNELSQQTKVIVPGLSEVLCGISRPQFFTGVATIVNRLFNLVQPDKAFFGKKDYQQLLIIKKMVADLAMNLDVVGVDTVRLDNGLAMSSRNNYLSTSELEQASVLNKVLKEVSANFTSENSEQIQSQGIESLMSAGFKPDYLSVRRQQDLTEPATGDSQLVVLVAAWLANTRLIDSHEFTL